MILTDRETGESYSFGENNFGDEQELKSIYRQLFNLVGNGIYEFRKIYDHPLDDDVLLPICNDDQVIFKEHIRNFVLEGITVYEYTFIYKGGEIIE